MGVLYLRWVGVILLETVVAFVVLWVAAHVNAVMQRPKD